MNHISRALLALLSFGIATFLLAYNVKEIAHAYVLLGVIVGFYLLAFTVAFTAQMAVARTEITAWWTAYRSGGGPA